MNKMRPLLIDADALDLIAALIAKASAEPTTYDEVKALAAKRAEGQLLDDANNEFTIGLRFGYRVTYTHEFQRADLVCRHISVSAPDAKPGTGPNPEAFKAIMREFGFKNTLDHLLTYRLVWTTQADFFIIEALEPLDGNCDALRRQP